MFMLPLFALLQRIAELTPFLPPPFPPPEISSSWGLQLLPPPLGLKRYTAEEVFEQVITSDLFHLNDDIPTLFHRSSGSHSSFDISFVPSSPAPGRCLRTWALIAETLSWHPTKKT